MAPYGITFMLTINSIHVDGLVQERRNSIANALELRLSCTNNVVIMLQIVAVKWQQRLGYGSPRSDQ